MTPISLRRCALAATLAGAAVSLATESRLLLAGDGPAAVQEEGSYGVDVELVRLSVTARDGSGALVQDLAREQLQVLEDGVSQDVVRFGHDETPISVVVLFDKSASMHAEKLMHAKDAVLSFVRELKSQDEVLIVAFSDQIDPLGDFGPRTRAIERTTKSIRAETGTRLYDATIEALRAIGGRGRKEKRALLLLSDGADTASQATLDQAVEAVRRAGVPVYAVGIEMEAAGPGEWDDAASNNTGRTDGPRRLGWDPLWRRREAPAKASVGPSVAIQALARLTRGTGGWTYPVAASRRCRDVCVRVARELRQQYLLGYRPTAPADGGGWREVEVRSSRPGVVLSTRSGYYAGGP